MTRWPPAPAFFFISHDSDHIPGPAEINPRGILMKMLAFATLF